LPVVIFGGDHADLPLAETAGELLADLVVDERVPAVLGSVCPVQKRRAAVHDRFRRTALSPE